MAMLKMLAAMAIFGSVGVVVDFISLPSPMIAGLRALIGALVLALVMIFRQKAVNKAAIRKHAGWLLLSGVALGANWILLFESYNYTSVAVATVCYYTAPLIVMMLSPVFAKEPFSPLRGLFMLVAVGGIALLSADDFAADSRAQLAGIALSIGAAALYATVMLLGKKLSKVPAQESTFCQLLVAALVTLPVALFTRGEAVTLSTSSIVPLLILGVVHTGLAYLLFFGAAAKLPAQTTALLSYLDPAIAVLLSACVLTQPLSEFDIVGIVAILGAAVLGELCGKKKRR